MVAMMDCAPEQLREGERLVIDEVERHNRVMWRRSDAAA
jgi:hypothetical protein